MPAIGGASFASLALSVLLILLSFTAVEMVLYERFLTLPNKVQRELQQLSASANQQRQIGAEALAQWEISQPYLLYVIDSTNHVVSGRDIHPHVQMKMRNARQLTEPMGTRVSKPMIIVPMSEGYSLMVQLPWQQHPASRAGYYLWSTNLLLSLLILTLISWVLSRQLQRPLGRLQCASRAVAQGSQKRVFHSR
ncbi:histidine kinase sensor domain-containing protein [Vibrio metschnikovii]